MKEKTSQDQDAAHKGERQTAVTAVTAPNTISNGMEARAFQVGICCLRACVAFGTWTDHLVTSRPHFAAPNPLEALNLVAG